MAATERVAAFAAFFKRYARTWRHAVATAAMTAFGVLAVLDQRFTVVAVLAYVLPPVVLYLRSPSALDTAGADGDRSDRSGSDERDRSGDRSSTGPASPGWSVAWVPTDETLTDAAVDGDCAYAVGTAGTVLRDAGEGLEAVVTDGPDAQSNALAGVDATGTGAVWFAGDSGSVGRFDESTGRHVSCSAPDGDTSNVVAIATAGTAETETVLLADGSGRLRRGRYSDGEMAWDEPTTPGSGSSLSGLVLATASVGYACDTNGSVFRTTDGGRSFDRIGVDGPGTPTGVAAGDPDSCLVCDDSGVVARYDGGRWGPERITDGALEAVTAGNGWCVATAPAGTVFERVAGDWTRAVMPATVTLDAVALSDARAVAVGADGTVVERDGVPGVDAQRTRR